MNNNILNEIKTIKKMMGLIVEQTKLKIGTGYGINPQNWNQFVEKAKISKDKPFYFMGYVFKLRRFGDDGTVMIHGTEWDVLYKLGTYTDKNAGGQNFPGFLSTLQTPAIMIRTGVDIYPPEKDVKFNYGAVTKIDAFNMFKNILDSLSPSDKQEIIKFYGEKINTFGEDLVGKL